MRERADTRWPDGRLDPLSSRVAVDRPFGALHSTVITEPVTTGGKNRTSLEKIGAMITPIAAVTMIAPKTTRRPFWPQPLPVMMVIIVETDANEMPWTNGSCEPGVGLGSQQNPGTGAQACGQGSAPSRVMVASINPYGRSAA